MNDLVKPKRWRPWQFGLKALLLLTLGAACVFAGWRANEVKRQRDLERAKAATMFADWSLDTLESMEEKVSDLVDIREERLMNEASTVSRQVFHALVTINREASTMPAVCDLVLGHGGPGNASN